MPWFILIVLLSVTSTCLSINRPVYKIVLKQKGYAQFLQYDLETPPLREFTICTWIRIYDLSGDQSIFTYVGGPIVVKSGFDDKILGKSKELFKYYRHTYSDLANGNNRVVRLWLDSGGKHINVSINGKLTSSSAVDITKDVWRHICLSYQSDFGAWALYVDSRLLSCQASQTLLGYVLPGGGSVIIGYGTADGGASNGLEGEIFGTNMILVSTIERNYTMRSDPLYEQKRFRKNKMKSTSTHANYIVLNDLQTGELKNTFETTQLPTTNTPNASKSFIKLRTPHSYIEHAVGLEFSSRKPSLMDMPNDFHKEFMGLTVTDKPDTTDSLSFWNLNNNEHTGRYNAPEKTKSPNFGPTTKSPLTLSEFETPPPVPRYTSLFERSSDNNMEKAFPGLTFKFKATTEPVKTKFNKKFSEELSEIETPPPVEKNAKVYGQWTSSKFAGSVLNYLKNIQLRSREQKKVPQTIPLTKLSDSFPYASDFKITKVRPPFQFQRRNLVEKQFETSKRSPQINVQILEEDIRNSILRSHAQTQPIHVEVTNRGVRKTRKQEHRFYRNVDNQDSNESYGSSETILKTAKPITPVYKPKQKHTADLTLQTNNLLSILPFLKSLEYFVENVDFDDTKKDQEKNDMYTRSLANGNKWHNVKSYSNDYTPRQVKIDPQNDQSAIEQTLAQANQRHPAIRLNYKHEERNLVPYREDPTLVRSRALAMEVSNQSDFSKNSVSILKYNHGFLPGHNKKIKLADKLHGATKGKSQSSSKNFNKQVKIGNALNERHVIGVNAEQNKRSFVGGNENIPDINKYRSDLDNIDSKVPGSLGPRVCKNIDLLDRVLYVQPDESIDMTHIVSPVRMKNAGIEFIMQNYKKCSLAESELRDNPMLFIDWSRTPVRLFGGSFPKTTTDLCGFF